MFKINFAFNLFVILTPHYPHQTEILALTIEFKSRRCLNCFNLTSKTVVN